MVQALTTNTGLVYVGDATMNVGTGVGVFATLGAPSSATVTPSSYSATQVNAADAFNLVDVFIDVSVNGEGAIVSIMRG